ncbi:MAG: heme NO-binding domain-containing protein [Pseudomonadota bacterium]
MHGMVNKGLQTYVTDIFGGEVWEDICVTGGLSQYNFETMLTYDDDLTDKIVEGATKVLNRSHDDILEDFGTHVAGAEGLPLVRQLLQFGGENFEEFLESLEELHDLCRIVLPELDVPVFCLENSVPGSCVLHYTFTKAGYGTVFLGILRAVASAYDTLALVDHIAEPGSKEGRFDITVLQMDLSGDIQDATTLNEVLL